MRDSPGMPSTLRVIAGEAKGRRLVTPGDARPTADRVREAIFSALGPDPIGGAVVLDLYAGSGALAIEALSRGATRAVLVDHDREAEAASEQNILSLGYGDRARVERTPVERFLEKPSFEAPFDLVFCDPPYAMPDVELAPVLDRLVAKGWLMDSALVVVERPAAEWSPPEGWTASWQRKYGDTLITIVHLAP